MSASNLALCQRCPMLLAYTVHRREKDAWKVGISGSGWYYGSLFHKNIARVFFEAASDTSGRLHADIAGALSGGEAALGEVVREGIFMPFLERHSGECSTGQIIAIAKGITVWVRAMSEFFTLIPSLMASPEENMPAVFIPPEQRLQAFHDCPEGRLVVTGCYDALLFNPDRAEARLFEFKGYHKSDLTVPLSQSLIYSWLVWKNTGVMPSVEIIYLDEEDKGPEVFSAEIVSDMVSACLPGLFRAAYGVMSMKRPQEMMRDRNLCAKCPFEARCVNDWRDMR